MRDFWIVNKSKHETIGGFLVGAGKGEPLPSKFE
jgi:hypothetical protein